MLGLLVNISAEIAQSSPYLCLDFGQACASMQSRRGLCYCSQRGLGGSACPRCLATAFAAHLYISRLNVLFVGCG